VPKLEAGMGGGGKRDEKASGGEVPAQNKERVDMALQRSGDQEHVGHRRRRHGEFAACWLL